MLPESAVEYLGEIEVPAVHVPQPVRQKDKNLLRMPSGALAVL